MNDTCKLAMIVLAGLISSASMAQHVSGGIDESVRAAWKHDAISYLLTVTPADFSNKIEFYESNRGYDAVLAFTLNRNGCVLFGENEWVCMISHSAHDNPKVGDIVLAVDSLSAIYQIETHICGGTAFFLGFDMSAPANTAEFFAKFKGDKVGRFWEMLPLLEYGGSGKINRVGKPQELTPSLVGSPVPKDS